MAKLYYGTCDSGLGIDKQKHWYLLCDETVESEYEQQSSADGGDDEAELVQVFDLSSLRGLLCVPTITVCRKKKTYSVITVVTSVSLIRAFSEEIPTCKI